jgi:hypothetical protein
LQSNIRLANSALIKRLNNGSMVVSRRFGVKLS